MKVYRPINNNIVSAFDDEGREVVVIGKGIGFQAKEGTVIPPSKIEKIFTMRSKNETERLKEILASLPREYLEITDEIITYAKHQLKRQLHEGIYITLADHINFTVLRVKQGMNLQNVLHSEIRRFYAKEYAIGKYALNIMQKRLGIVLPDDEAASIALHIFNAEYDISISDAFHAIKLLDHILDIVTEKTGLVIDETNYYCERFITHLKFLTQRIVKNEILPESDDEFFEIIRVRYHEELKCSEYISDYVYKNYGYTIPREHTASLAIHIKRIKVSGTGNTQV